MAFDTRQLRTCKELLKLSKVPRGLQGYGYAPFEGRIFVRFGRFYVTNSFSLVCVEWNEYQHAGDEEWLELSRFMDDDGKLIEFEFKTAEKQRANDIFERQFIEKVDFSDYLPINPKLLSNVLKVFEINDLKPIMLQDGARWQLSAHNRDVSVKAVVMGVRS